MHEDNISTVKKKRRPPLTSSQWAQHVTAWKTSGLNKKEYCEQHDINSTCLIQRARIMGVSRDKKFKAVKVAVSGAGIQTASTAGVEIIVGQSIRVRLTGVSEPSFIVGIIRGLHACN